ncbi:hypothetical protein [Chroogloeocystis siderophila]|nr:hypothetical protein [Chroogloeocystis siderophila]
MRWIWMLRISMAWFITVQSVLSTVMMDKSRVETAGTDYTFQTSVVYFSTILAGAIGGIIAEHLGYQSLFLICIAISCINVVAIIKGLHSLDSMRSP